jgi:hypothetical protein
LAMGFTSLRAAKNIRTCLRKMTLRKCIFE